MLQLADGTVVCQRCRQPAERIGQRAYWCRACNANRKPPQVTPSRPESGPGTELKHLLKRWLGIVASVGCRCNAIAREMNARGADWCETVGMSKILSAMQAEHAKRWAAGKIRLPWSEWGAKRLVLLACRRARGKA